MRILHQYEHQYIEKDYLELILYDLTKFSIETKEQHSDRVSKKIKKLLKELKGGGVE